MGLSGMQKTDCAVIDFIMDTHTPSFTYLMTSWSAHCGYSLLPPPPQPAVVQAPATSQASVVLLTVITRYGPHCSKHTIKSLSKLVTYHFRT